MRIVERGIERFNSLSPKRQKAVEYFALSGLAASLTGVSVFPLVEGFGTGFGIVGVVEGTAISAITYRWGWQSLEQARREESQTS